MAQANDIGLRDVLTDHEPLGPQATEDILGHLDAFLELYDKKARLIGKLVPNRPAYVIGRKGAGKTAFLIGESLSSGNDVVSVRAANAFGVVEEIRRRWMERRSALPADSLVYIWEAILVHSAMRGALDLGFRADATRLSVLKSYLNSIDEHETGAATSEAETSPRTAEDQFLWVLGQRLVEAIDAEEGLSAIRDVVGRLGTPDLDYFQARETFREMLEQRRESARLSVVVDNLEDLQMRFNEVADVLAGLFRIVSRVVDPIEPIKLPFDLRFAFPAELTDRLSSITANPEKDFRNSIVIDWTASELMELAGIRIRRSLELRFGADNELPSQISAARRPEDVLRQVLPEDDIVNGMGRIEDPVAYVMRHTQLLPRHLILILNQVLSPMFSSGHFRRVTQRELLGGIRDAEKVLRDGILSSYLYDYPWLGSCLERLKNTLPFSFDVPEARRQYTQAGVKRSTGQRFEEFLWAAVTAGVFGLVRDTTERYVIADFYYTFPGGVRPLEGDRLCIHPLFVHLLNDQRALDRLSSDPAVLPVYPYGSGVEEP